MRKTNPNSFSLYQKKKIDNHKHYVNQEETKRLQKLRLKKFKKEKVKCDFQKCKHYGLRIIGGLAFCNIHERYYNLIKNRISLSSTTKKNTIKIFKEILESEYQNEKKY